MFARAVIHFVTPVCRKSQKVHALFLLHAIHSCDKGLITFHSIAFGYWRRVFPRPTKEGCFNVGFVGPLYC